MSNIRELYPLCGTLRRSVLRHWGELSIKSDFFFLFLLLLQINSKVQIRSYLIIFISFFQYIPLQQDGWDFWQAQAHKRDWIQQETDCSSTPTDLFSCLWVIQEQSNDDYVLKIWLFTTSDAESKRYQSDSSGLLMWGCLWYLMLMSALPAIDDQLSPLFEEAARSTNREQSIVLLNGTERCVLAT